MINSEQTVLPKQYFARIKARIAVDLKVVVLGEVTFISRLYYY